MIKFEEITSFVSSAIDKYFGPKTIWPGITDEVRKTSLKLANTVQSVYDQSLSAILGQCDKPGTEEKNTHECGCSKNRQEAKQPDASPATSNKAPEIRSADPEITKAAEPKTKETAASSDPQAAATKPPARKPRAKKDTNAEPAGTKPAKTRAKKSKT
ncbi:MAG: hypothetical protein HQK99_09975 [Nitrospirae bacterium]|nr:hypothetical protein [Nitrospirota bacterium]